MAPQKKIGVKKGVETLQKDVSKIASIERDVGKIASLEQGLEEIRKHLTRFDSLERLAQRLNEEDKIKRRKEKEPMIVDDLVPPLSVVRDERVKGGSSGEGLVHANSPIQEPLQILNAEGSVTRTTNMIRPEKPPDDRDGYLMRKIKIPTFDGEEAESWVMRIEQYFELEELTEAEKLRSVRMCFLGEALVWYCWERERHPFTTWEQMKERVLEQYAMSHDTNAGERLLMLRQKGFVKSYCKDFIALASNAPELTDKVLEMAFMIGLKPRIRAGVRMFEPKTLKKMMEVAKMVEDWNENGGDPRSRPPVWVRSPIRKV